jgi:hypothetical protein
MKLIFVLLLGINLAACFSNEQTINPGEKFTLEIGKTAKVKDTNLQLKMLGGGSAMLVNRTGTSFCKIEANSGSKKDEKNLYQSVGMNSLLFEGFKIELQSASYDGKSCSFIVTKTEK